MDPVSAIGAASGAITFVELAYRFLSAVYAVYDTERAVGYDEVADINKKMQELSRGMLSKLPTANQSDRDIAIAELARQCYMLTVDIGERIAKIKPKSRKISAVVKAAMRAVCSMSELKQLQWFLANCSSQLHFQCTVADSADARESLGRLESASSAFADVMERSKAISNQRNILSSLRFALIDERYHNVSEAAESTYAWIFEDPHRQTDSNEMLVRPFMDWLRSGNGIFHISGKPGSGKSTLMKYICTSNKTRLELQQWAGTNTLIFGRFFFWKPGSVLQKSLLGLIRSLLYHVLSQRPEVIPAIFPQYWDPSQYCLWSPQQQLCIGNKEILDGFNALLRNVEIYEHCRLCFFIDGLDEFDEDIRSYQDLVACLQDWVELSKGRLKLCVSSRELPTFQGRLAIDQRIRLQDLTLSDITTVIHQSLGCNSSFQALRQQNPRDCLRLMAQIARKSDGVFLWIILTLKTISEALECRDSLSAIFDMVDSLPQELDDFFASILTSIPRAQRKKAYSSLAYAVGTSKLHASPDDVEFFYLFTTGSLFRWSFLDGYIGAEDFAACLNFREMSQREIFQRVEIGAAQVQGRCRGLLELRPKNIWLAGISALDVSPYDDIVRFIHRSIPEFLEDYLQTDAAKKYTGNFDFIDAHIKTLLALVKSTGFDERHSMIPSMYDELQPLIDYIHKTDGVNIFKYCKALDDLDEALIRRYEMTFPDFATQRWKKYGSTPWIRPSLTTPVHIACHRGFHEYPVWKAKKYPRLLRGTDGVEMVQAVLDGCQSFENDKSQGAAERSAASLEELLELGIDLNCKANNEQYGHLSLWVLFLQRICAYTVSDHHWMILEVMLRHGAVAPMWKLSKSKEVLLLGVGSELYCHGHDTLIPDWSSNLVPMSVLERGDTATLRDFVEMDKYDVKNEAAILELLGKASQDAAALTTETVFSNWDAHRLANAETT